MVIELELKAIDSPISSHDQSQEAESFIFLSLCQRICVETNVNNDDNSNQF